MDCRVSAVESLANSSKQVHEINLKQQPQIKQEPIKEDDDDVDLFASDSDEESAEAAKIREERLAAYAAKKSKSMTNLIYFAANYTSYTTIYILFF